MYGKNMPSRFGMDRYGLIFGVGPGEACGSIMDEFPVKPYEVFGGTENRDCLGGGSC